MVAQVHAISEARLPETFRLGECRVDLNANVVIAGSREQRLTPKAAAVLAYLAARPGRAIGREELMDAVWADAYPTDDVLSHAVTELRRALGDSVRNSRFIETIPKVGYRLLQSPEVGAAAGREDDAAPRFPWAVLVGAFVLGAVTGWALFRFASRPPPVTPVARQAADPLEHSFPVTALPETEWMPAVSEDGRQIAYVRVPGPGELPDIHIKAIGAELSVPLTSTPEFAEYSPAWSPDGSEVAYLQFSDDRCRVVVKPVAGGLERDLADCEMGAVTYLDWSPDGGELVKSAFNTEGGYGRFEFLDVATGAVTVLDYSRTSEHDVQPKYSPDGQWLAFRRGANPRSELYLVSREGGEVEGLTDFGSRIFGFDWVDNERIWFCAHGEGPAVLWETSIVTGATRQISDACAHGLAIAPGARVLAYEEHSGQADLVLFSDEDTSGTPLFMSTRDEGDAAFDPDGSRVVFVSNRTGEDQLWLGEIATGRALQLTRLAGLTLAEPRFSPDGDTVVFVGRGGGQESLYRVSLSSGIVERLSAPDERVRVGAVGADGRIYMTSNSSGSWQIWSLDPTTGEQRQVTDAGGHRPVLPGDGHVYYTKLDRYGLWRRPLAGGDEELVSEEIRFANHENWLIVDGQLITPRSAEGEGMKVVAFPLAGGEPRRLLEFPPERNPKLLAVSPVDGRILMVEISDAREDILAAVDF